MGKKRRILLAALLVALLCGFGWWLLRPNEPSYKGKSLSAWLNAYGYDGIGSGSRDADKAVRQVGTNAIPPLLQMLRASDSPLIARCIELLDRQNLVSFRITPAPEKNFEAYNAFQALGPLASNAVPGLIEIYGANISQSSQALAAGSLGEIGPPAKPAIPALLKGLKTTNDLVRLYTVAALNGIHSEPESVVPELVRLLRDSDAEVRMLAAAALGNFGTNAESAVPDLIVMLNDGNGPTREMTTNALKQIDPTAAARAGIK
jgi:hypothetical protein